MTNDSSVEAIEDLVTVDMGFGRLQSLPESVSNAFFAADFALMRQEPTLIEMTLRLRVGTTRELARIEYVPIGAALDIARLTALHCGNRNHCGEWLQAPKALLQIFSTAASSGADIQLEGYSSTNACVCSFYDMWVEQEVARQGRRHVVQAFRASLSISEVLPAICDIISAMLSLKLKVSKPAPNDSFIESSSRLGVGKATFPVLLACSKRL